MAQLASQHVPTPPSQLPVPTSATTATLNVLLVQDPTTINAVYAQLLEQTNLS